MGKKYLDTKENSLESSIMDVWKQAAEDNEEINQVPETIDQKIWPEIKELIDRNESIKNIYQVEASTMKKADTVHLKKVYHIMFIMI